ncbi:hypothetical protein [Dellaglioa algida]|uniref:Uncharacterized protein n=1 Tax=Dellaglioa algida TaxID=105612 RepID=A0A2C8EL72_9LACO|nr:hypothetical protein [Dellaglioa algida]MDK1716306.1 hypothetical protein [Dellaglioa algida]MDK1717985.1 hypothetical protein [Dellaglioa algida]MDK1719587.1 hypothetical protein [Dellaglioa algida]MDK1720911.1 hypothetical protein [Dellaglioa algida]MDK1722930.1 hypothetical protein [Dellaglioa algida]
MFKKINTYINAHYIKTFILALATATIFRVLIEFFTNHNFLNIEFIAASVTAIVVSILIGQDFRK